MEILIVPVFLMALGCAAALVENPLAQWAYARCRAWWRRKARRDNVIRMDDWVGESNVRPRFKLF
jgi:hypothetical protein